MTNQGEMNMAEMRSVEERLAELDQKMEQIKAQKKAILQKEKAQQKQAQIKRLFAVGAAVESVLGRPIEREEIPKLIEFLEQKKKKLSGSDVGSGEYFTYFIFIYYSGVLGVFP